MCNIHIISILALIKYPNYQTPPSKGHVSGFKQAKPSEQHWDHSRFRGHLVLALAAVSSHTHMHLPCILVSFSGSQPLARTLSLTLAHTGNQWAVSILQRWRGEVERRSESVRQKDERRKTAGGGGEEERGHGGTGGCFKADTQTVCVALCFYIWVRG